MVRHLFTLIWNKKKQNFLLITEMLISFLVLFAVFTLLVFYYGNYKKSLGFEYENVWTATYSQSLKTNNTDSLVQFYETVRQSLLALPQVKALSFTSSNTPFTPNTIQNAITHKGKLIRPVNWHASEDSYHDVLKLKLISGRWFNRTDAVAKNQPMVIDVSLKEALFGSGNAVGELVGDGDNAAKRKVIGVVEDPKFKGDYSTPGYVMFNRVDSGSFRDLNKILIRVSPAADAAFEAKLYKTMANAMKNANVEIEHVSDKRTSINNFALVPMIVLSIVCTFLIVNVALGLFGVLWYNINKRRGEIGLRRAIGASGKSISAQLVAESMILATLSLIIGSFFAIQFPLLNVFDLPAGIYLWALLLSIFFIYLLVLTCSLYPGTQAAAIYPAVALHEE